jgi:DNA invertase Pin-like site-specific DNA recombinase
VAEFVAYYRVSTDRQGASGLGLEAQREAVMRHIGWQYRHVLAEFTEIESGRRDTNRPELHAALAQCRKSGATLLIARLDRLARNVAFIAGLMESGVDFVAVDMPQANRLTIHIMAAFAEHEREMISSRTKAALAQAKARGTRLGNPRPLDALKLANAARAQEKPARHVLDLMTGWRTQGKGLRAIARELNRLNIRTPRGCTWYACTVKAQLAPRTAV